MENGLFKVFKGDKNGNSKLTNDEVIKIKELIKEGKSLNKNIASIFNVSPGTISAIKHKRLRNYE